jgi:methyl-accepting chemotaxis protein
MEDAVAWRAQYTTPLGAAAVKAFTRQIEITSRNDIARRDAQQHAANRTFVLLALMGTATMLFGLAAAFYVYRSINRPLQRLQSAIDGVAAGDFTARTQLGGGDELGRVGASFDRLLDERVAGLAEAQAENERLNNSVISVLQAVNLMSQRDLTARAPVTQDVIGTVADSINALSDETSKVLRGVSHIAGQVQEVSGKVKLQAELVSRTAQDERQSVNLMIESLGEATKTMKHVAALADLSNRSAEQATQVTDTALETVNGTVKGMELIRETIAETEKRIKRLGERSQEISGIVNLINTISERTHVLALNASMQAAVAGEAGRGFAVVAEEVQRLAESSRTASQQIGALVGNIQLETNETISTVNRTIGQVVHGSEQAQKAGEQMRHTKEITGQLVAQVKRIAESSEQQKEMSANLLQSVRNIGQSTERTAQQIVTQNQETETLLDSARRLVESVGVFKLSRVA